jgi:U3 small nucleolar ribonucleoprotein protein IMP3
MGLTPTKGSLVQCDKISVSTFCRRRLPILLVRMKMAETLREATTFVEQGRMWTFIFIIHFIRVQIFELARKP